MSPLNMGLAIAGLLAIIYIVTHVAAFKRSPLGKSLTKLLGDAQTFLTAVAGLPSWLLIGGAAAFLLGPAIMKMSGWMVRAFGRGAERLRQKTDELAKTGAPEEVVDAYAKGAATQLNSRIREKVAAEENADADAQVRAARAQDARKATRSEASASPETKAADADGAEDADEALADVAAD